MLKSLILILPCLFSTDSLLLVELSHENVNLSGVVTIFTHCGTKFCTYNYSCLGFLVHPKIVLTLSHCLPRINPASLIKVQAYDWNKYSDIAEFTPLERRNVFRVINHPLTEHKGRFDFAAVILKTPLDLDPIELPNPNDIYQNDCVVFDFKSDFKRVVCGVGADVAYHRHIMGYYVTVASAMIFFLEITWAITLFVQICFRNEEAICSRCWSYVLKITEGWRRALFYLPLSSILAWKPHNLWLSFVAAGLLAALSLLHIISSLLSQRTFNRPNSDSMGERLLNARPEIYDRFEEVLVTEVLDDGVGGPTGRLGDSDGEI